MGDSNPDSDSPPRCLVPGVVGTWLAAAYGAVMARRNARYDRRRGVVEIDRPVVSVGNLSVGGTGKTPMVMHLLGVLRDAGRHPAVAMRGYARRGADGDDSDEAREYRDAFPHLPIVARPDRLTGLLHLFATPEGERVDTVVLDDGFQHRRIARQFDIVLVDATRDPFADALLPAGWLREPVVSLARASAVVVTHAEASTPSAVGRLLADVRRVSPTAVTAVCRHVWDGLDIHARAGNANVEPGWLRGRRVFAACAIGNPGPFLREAERRVGTLAGRLTLPDHDPYEPATVGRLFKELVAARAEVCVVTPKDWAKLRRVPAGEWPAAVAVPRLALAFDTGGPELEEAMLDAVRAVPPPETAC
jgi:tetraacyldisaccharide 4'-kinase